MSFLLKMSLLDQIQFYFFRINALRSVEASHNFLEHSNGLLCALAGEAQRAQNTHKVSLVPTLAKQHACLPAFLKDLCQQLRIGFSGYFVLHKLHSQHHALATHLSNILALLSDSPKLRQQVSTHFLGILRQFLLADDVQYLHSDSALERSSCEGGEVVVGEGICDFPSGDNCGEGGAVGDCLGHNNDVRLDLLPLEAPLLLADASEARLHLVRNVEAAHLLHQSMQVLHVALLQWDDSSRTHHWLQPQSCYLAICAAVQLLFCVLKQRLHRSVCIPVEVGPGQPLNSIAFGQYGVPSADAGEIVGISSCTVVAVPEADHGVALGVGLGQVVSEVVGLAARVEEEHSVEVVAEFLAQLFGELTLIGVGVVGGEIQQFLAFLPVDLGDPGM